VAAKKLGIAGLILASTGLCVVACCCFTTAFGFASPIQPVSKGVQTDIRGAIKPLCQDNKVVNSVCTGCKQLTLTRTNADCSTKTELIETGDCHFLCTEVKKEAAVVEPAPALPPPTEPTPPVPVPTPPTIQEAEPYQGCCKVCSKGKACGNSCIAQNKTCHKAKGCACDS